MMFLWLPILFLIPLAMMWMMRSGNGMSGRDMSHAARVETPPAGGPDSIEIARQRLARGEISTTEYEEIRHAIG
jgi:uncharacterized membrane protein